MERKPKLRRSHLQLVAPAGALVIPFPLERRKHEAEQQAKERGLARLVELVFGPEPAA
ncbi:MAG TPA: hypothetical protein VGF23_25220 [Gaiellaceae bacterium]